MSAPSFFSHRVLSFVVSAAMLAVVSSLALPLFAQEDPPAAEQEQEEKTDSFGSKAKMIAESLNYSRMGDHEKALQVMEDLYEKHPEDIEIRQQLLRRLKVSALRSATSGKEDRAYELYVRVADLIRSIYPAVPEEAREGYRLANCTMFYNEACSFARMDEDEKAVNALKMAIDWGFKDLTHLLNDNDLAKLVDGPEVKEMLGETLNEYSEKVRTAYKEQISSFTPVDFELELSDLAKNKVDMSASRGKLVVICFWSTGNVQSQKNLETLIRFHRNYSNEEIKLFCVACEKTNNMDAVYERVTGYFAENAALPFTCMVANYRFRKQMRATQGFPVTLVINQEGKLQAVFKENLEYFSLRTMADILLEK